MPDREGWYFASYSDLREIECVRVVLLNNYHYAFRVCVDTPYLLENFKWFGRVPMPVEMDSYDSKKV